MTDMSASIKTLSTVPRVKEECLVLLHLTKLRPEPLNLQKRYAMNKDGETVHTSEGDTRGGNVLIFPRTLRMTLGEKVGDVAAFRSLLQNLSVWIDYIL